MRKVTPKEAAQFNADFVKIFTSGAGIGLVIFGYSYTHTFFRSFGLSLFQLKMDWTDILFRGTALIQSWYVAILFALIIVLGSFIFSLRNLVRPAVKVMITAFVVLGLLLAATLGGKALGYQHARAIWEGGAGKKAFCRFDPNAPGMVNLVAKIDQLTRQQHIRLIHQTKDHTYLAPVIAIVRPGQTTGEAYVIPTNAIVFCRIVGS